MAAGPGLAPLAPRRSGLMDRIDVSFDAGNDEPWIEDLEHPDVHWRTSVPAIGTKVRITRPDHSYRTWRVMDVIHETHFPNARESRAYQITRVVLEPVPAE